MVYGYNKRLREALVFTPNDVVIFNRLSLVVKNSNTGSDDKPTNNKFMARANGLFRIIKV